MKSQVAGTMVVHSSSVRVIVCLFDPGTTPTPADSWRIVTSCNAGHQEVGRCSNKHGSKGIYITFPSKNSK